MGTFLVTAKMAPELVARIDRSIGRARRNPAERAVFAGKSRFSLLGLMPILALASTIVILAMVVIGHHVQKRETERQRAILLTRVRSENSWVSGQVQDFVPHVELWIGRLAGPYPGDTVSDELRVEGNRLGSVLSRPAVYLRAAGGELAMSDGIAKAAAGSIKDSFLLCLVDPPSSRAESALLAKVRGTNFGGALVEERTQSIRRLFEAKAGLAVLQPSWTRRIELAQAPKELAKLVTEFDRAPIQAARRATSAEVLVFVMDEPATAGAGAPAAFDDDLERVHDARVAIVDLRTDKVLLRIRRRIDPNAWSPASRPLFAHSVDGCALAVDVHGAIGAGR